MYQNYNGQPYLPYANKGNVGGGGGDSGGAGSGNGAGGNSSGDGNGGGNSSSGDGSGQAGPMGGVAGTSAASGNIGTNGVGSPAGDGTSTEWGWSNQAALAGLTFGPIGGLVGGVVGGSNFGGNPNGPATGGNEGESNMSGPIGTGGQVPAPIATGQPGNFENLEQAGVYGGNQAFDLYNQGPATPFAGQTVAGFGGTTNNAHNQITGLATGNQHLPGATQRVSDLTTESNPFLQGFNSFSDQQNQHLDSIHNRGANDLQDRLNSQFGGGGRSNSGMHSLTTGRALGDYSASLYGNAYDAQQNRNLQALNGGSNAYQGQTNSQLYAANMLPGLNDAKFDDARELQGIGGAQDIMSQLQLDGEINQHNTAENSGWNNLQNYMNIVNGVSPTQQPAGAPAPPRSNSTTDTLSDLLTAYAVYNGGKS